MQSTHITQIFKSRQILLEQLKEQNYEIDKYNNFTINEINTMNNTNQLDMILTKTDLSKKLYVKYHINKSLRNNNIFDYIEELFDSEDILTKKDDLIIITKDEPNEQLIKVVKNFWDKEGYYISLYNIKRLQFNILNHCLQPKHTVLSSKEADIIKKKYNIIDDTQIPEISRFSPVAIAICIRPKELCQIIRPSNTAINAPFYRICSS